MEDRARILGHAWRKLVEAIKENWKLAYIIYVSIN